MQRSPSDDVGSTDENLLRHAQANVLLTADPAEAGRLPEAARPDETAIAWDPEAKARLQKVPPFARQMARKGIEDYARQHGHSHITLKIYHEARQHFGMS